MVNGAVVAMARDIEYEMFYGLASPQEKLKNLLFKLGVKTAQRNYLHVESLDVLNTVTFDSQMLGKWPTKKST